MCARGIKSVPRQQVSELASASFMVTLSASGSGTAFDFPVILLRQDVPDLVVVARPQRCLCI